MLTALHLGNFKAFAETRRIPLKPITLIFGANSAGKSSLIHSLCLAHEATKSGDLDVHRTTIGGESVDLGGFRQYVHRRETQRRVEWGTDIDTAKLQGRLAELFAPVKQVSIMVQIGLRHIDRTRKGRIVDTKTGETIIADIPTEEAPIPIGKPYVTSYEILADGKSILRASGQYDETKETNKKTLQLDVLDHEHPIFHEVIKALVAVSTTTESLSEEDFAAVGNAVNNLVPEINLETGNFLPNGLERTEDLRGLSGMMTFLPISRANREDDLANAVRLYIPNILHEMIKGLTEAVRAEFERFSYLGPLRSYPPRHLAFAQHHDTNWKAGGGEAWDIVRRDDDVRKLVNQWLGNKDRLQTPYQLDVRRLYDADEIDDPVAEQAYETDKDVRRLLLHLVEVGMMDAEISDEQKDIIWSTIQTEHNDLGELEVLPSSFEGPYEFTTVLSKALDGIDPVTELSLVDLRTNTKVSHRDVGIGISQVLPVLVNAYASNNKIIAIEQPEIHLHPALQAELGDVFIESALGQRKNTFLIETHSEHLILRLMRRMRDTFNERLPDGLPQITPDDIAVLYVQPKSNSSSSVVSFLELDEEGQLLDPFPGGFFEEGFRERFS